MLLPSESRSFNAREPFNMGGMFVSLSSPSISPSESRSFFGGFGRLVSSSAGVDDFPGRQSDSKNDPDLLEALTLESLCCAILHNEDFIVDSKFFVIGVCCVF